MKGYATLLRSPELTTSEIRLLFTSELCKDKRLNIFQNSLQSTLKKAPFGKFFLKSYLYETYKVSFCSSLTSDCKGSSGNNSNALRKHKEANSIDGAGMAGLLLQKQKQKRKKYINFYGCLCIHRDMY